MVIFSIIICYVTVRLVRLYSCVIHFNLAALEHLMISLSIFNFILKKKLWNLSRMQSFQVYRLISRNHFFFFSCTCEIVKGRKMKSRRQYHYIVPT